MSTINLPSFQPLTAIAVLSILYTVGIVGIAWPIHPEFVLLTPLNLLVSLGIVLYFHQHWSARTYQFLVLAYAVGFGAELFGVQTGILFGDYAYGAVLGWKVWGTPLMIGVNWVLLGYCSGVTANTLLPKGHWAMRGLLAAILMVGLDVLIEPVAMHYGFWDWEGDTVPLRNYLGWFLVALPLVCFFAYGHRGQLNKVAVALFIAQIVFFATLGLTI